ncbi:RusA family crossover junction endodeoxyribonuclease [Salinarimonas soli]|uniref:RusA family crossover junction endodeoxyribonuclease n=1 Tax=Salinarimonas soli TaxID=1638099 RepID=A0A5B2VDV6_9HYPH|nr:RusA family crossover junction endodeoxyribonuclease [Salinarimonas soli]KAA2237703.1 RusA family crossover junction endodeoxyribonuclease [Salinarimonas soli]
MSELGPVTIRLAGEPKGKGRARSTLIKPKAKPAFISTYPDPDTAMYESHLKLAAQRVMEGRPLLTGPLQVSVFAFMTIPASWSRKRQDMARRNELRPTKKPDWDNFAKILDALNKVVWDDDAQIVDGFVRKFFSDTPELVVTVEPARLPVPGVQAAVAPAEQLQLAVAS